ncbi:helix-turn-helix transcriptional regulator [Blastococcus sp. SYSU D00695]
MRADRLIATLLLLQARGRVTAAQVSRELEVSVRTARRDLEALATAGVPVYSVAGRGGGWALVGGARTDLSGLTAGEARALFLAAGPAGDAAPAVQAALRKLAQALPAPLREPARTAAAAVVVDPSGWDGRPRPAPEHLPALERAVVEGERVRLDYAGRAREPGTREVDPLGLVAKGGVWYLVAGTTAGVRTFRVDRVRSVAGTGLPVERPADFDLAAAWAASAAAVAVRRGGVRVRALADPEALARLRVRFGTRLTAGEPGADGRVPVELAGPAAEFVAAEVAGFGARVEVVDPPEARAHLAALARELAEVYAGPAVDSRR